MNREEVTAVACDYRERVLKYLRENTEDPGVERHLEECMECRALVEGYLEQEKELDIPEAGYEGTDEELKERVVHFEKGTRRILVFTLVGFVLGWFSIAYFTDSFLVTKVILAIPYKASEMLHNLFHSHPYSYYGGNGMFTEFNDLFGGADYAGSDRWRRLWKPRLFYRGFQDLYPAAVSEVCCRMGGRGSSVDRGAAEGGHAAGGKG